MLPKHLRLPRAAFVLPRARRFASSHFMLASVPAKGCAVLVSKKIARTASARHLLKRRVLSVVRSWCAREEGLIISARAGAPALPFPTLKRELLQLGKDAGLVE